MTNEDVLALFEGLRLADIRDGMDWAGLHNVGSVNRAIGPVFQGAEAMGIARTVLCRPTQVRIPTMTPEEYSDWSLQYYLDRYQDRSEITPNVKPGEFIVFESAGTGSGEIGSANSLEWHAMGARGIVTTGGVRDIDECIRHRIPIFSAHRAQTMVQGYSELAATQVPVNLDGTLVNPGDLIVANGDGVLVVPQTHFEIVAKWARRELDRDKEWRTQWYDKLGWDDSRRVL
ncbi:RraA family protein [Celeribacter indicus]|uniref:Putative 4-hydroxy-4-methyl-2-oxoglutarate aldolase n=1 Tax=Celeribacter indicus TaxID=1208324 RepID=A0A0B5E0G5_9RHOB|nr:RraA family protein [Celeribacter indicus]AJE48739.1 Demethylmenaquinone methyltransferase [Celeribacter indicus]SDX11736.1 Regulator of RNase E activity RraA [Celeribacter indicus]